MYDTKKNYNFLEICTEWFHMFMYFFNPKNNINNDIKKELIEFNVYFK